MAETDWEKGSFAAPQTSSTNWETGALTAPDKGGLASDLAKSVKVGVQRLPGMVAGLADLPIAAVSGARPVTAAADAIGKATGFQPGKWADETKFSAGHEQGRKAVDDAPGSRATLAPLRWRTCRIPATRQVRWLNLCRVWGRAAWSGAR